jgi:FeS assembly SUF system protein
VVETVTKKQIVDRIKQVFDPEIPVNVYDLGLIYEIKISGNNNVHINMTLTSPNCPVAGTLPREVAQSVRTIKAINDLNVQVVWDPPWDKDMMSDEVRLALNLF